MYEFFISSNALGKFFCRKYALNTVGLSTELSLNFFISADSDSDETDIRSGSNGIEIAAC